MPEPFDPIDLVSPHTHGSHVAHAQHILQGNNRWNKHFYQGPLNGNYDRATAAAVRHAKTYLGFPMSHVNGHSGDVFGARLLSYLVDEKNGNYAKLPFRYRLRKRRRARERNDWHKKVVNVGRRYLNVTEHPPNSNQTIFNQWYYGSMVAGAWCGMYASFIIQKAGGPKWFKYAYCPNIKAAALSGYNGMHITHEPQEGDVVLFDWDNDGIEDHVEIFEKWVDRGAGSFKDIGGNTGPSDKSNGGMVMEEIRYMSDVDSFIHVP